MRIAQVAPLEESVPPQGYGGTERVVHFLTEELVRRGHRVTLFASGDSETSAELVPICRRGLRLDTASQDHLPHQVLQLERVAQRAADFDVVHFHTEPLHLPLARRLDTPHLTTTHGRLDLPDLAPLYTELCDVPLVSISDAQRAPLPFARWLGTVHHGLPLDLFHGEERPGEYLVFLGRICRDKRIDRAIEIARRVDLPLRVAAKIEAKERDYYEEVRPLLDDPHVELLGEVGEDGKQELLGGARALLFPIDWPEPFGLVTIEALACGTPVVAWPHGAVPEVLEDGVTGFLVDSVEAAAAAVERIGTLSRRRCREVFEERFSTPRMADDYLALYERLIAERRPALAPPVRPAVPAALALVQQ
ncbi:MAG TPA: glycosyltransferase family 4 protein [Thermoanaerobaculia bacterium]|nr:glycosyltransferase family 4 protein [Thermoanaerobaculia bacterium]